METPKPCRRTEEADLVVLSNHLLPVLRLARLHRLLGQFVLAGFKLALALDPRAGRHLVLGDILHVCQQALQVTDPALERIGTGTISIVFVGIGPLVLFGVGTRFLGGGGAGGVGGIGGFDFCDLVEFAFLRHVGRLYTE
jgi:hypothetical protein